MNDVVKWFTVYLINSVWQIPVLAACTAVVLKAAARSGAKLHYRLWVGCLLLATVLPALPSMNRAPRFSGHRSGSVSVAIWAMRRSRWRVQVTESQSMPTRLWSLQAKETLSSFSSGFTPSHSWLGVFDCFADWR